MSREALRVYAGCPLGNGPPRPTRDGAVVLESLALGPAPLPITSIVDQEMLRILGATPFIGESVQRAFDRKEQELRELFMGLTHTEAAELFDRISSNDASPLARLTAERRNRLMVCLMSSAKGRKVLR